MPTTSYSTWKPAYCYCRIGIAYPDDDPNIRTPVESFQDWQGITINTYRCPYHSELTDINDLYTALVEEGNRVGWVLIDLNQYAYLQTLHIEDGEPVFPEEYIFNINAVHRAFSHDTSRALTVTVDAPEFADDKVVAQARADSQFGTGKVIYA